MSDTNRIFISGDVVLDAELTSDQQGPALYFKISNNRRYNDGSGWKDKFCVIEIEAYDYLATRYAPHLKKGRKVVVEGYLKEVALERGHTYAVYATSLFLTEVPAYEAGKGKPQPARASARRPEAKPREEDDVVQRLAAGVGEPPPPGAPFEDE